MWLLLLYRYCQSNIMKILDIEADDDDFLYFVLTYFLLEHPTVKSTSTLYNQEEVYKETRFVVIV